MAASTTTTAGSSSSQKMTTTEHRLLALTSEMGGLLSSASKMTLSACKMEQKNRASLLEQNESELVREAQLQLMEKIEIDIKHVVRSLESIWDEVGYSDEERGLQMDKLSDELTQTLRAKLAQEVEVRDVFKKDIETKAKECLAVARALGAESPELEEALSRACGLRLSHGLMRLEEEQARLENMRVERLAMFEPLREAMFDLASRLEVRLDARFSAEADSVDLGESRLRVFEAKLADLKRIEAERTAECAKLDAQSRALVEELENDDEDDDDDEFERAFGRWQTDDVGPDAVERASRRLTALREEKASRLSRLSALGDQISLLWEWLDVDAESQRRFRALCRESTIKKKTFRLGEAELSKLKAELKDRVGDLVADRRNKITALWDELDVADDERAKFPAFFSQTLDEDALAEHEEMLAKLQVKRDSLQPLLALVQRREKLLDERYKVEKLQADPTRLTRRLAGSHAERKYEMEAERRVKHLPKLTEKLIAHIKEWEHEEGPFFWHNQRYLTRIQETEQAWNTHKQELKAQALAKKEAASKKENVVNGSH